MSYSKAQIANLCTLVTSGGTPLTSVPAYYDPKEIPWLKTGEVNYCRIYDTESYISKEGLARSSAKMIPANSVVVAMYGQGDTAGRVAINKIPLSTNQACCNLVINHVIADYEYVYYALCTLYDRLVALKNGGAQPNLNAKKIRAIEIPFPDLETQRTIASVLGAYDNLIENNQKQIKLLEEAAQRLYKEWFVDLHFPGYEDTPIVDGVPEGWTLGELGDIAIDSGKKEKKEHRGQYQYYLPIDCLPKRSLAYTDKNDITLAESSLVAFMPNDILFGAMRPYFHKVVVARDKGLTRTTCFVINSKMPAYWAYLLLLLFSKDTVDYATQISVGTTMPYVRWKDFIHMPTLIPPEEKCDAFQAIVLPIIERISCLAVSSERLIQARDRLLPKLMSGEIEV